MYNPKGLTGAEIDRRISELALFHGLAREKARKRRPSWAGLNTYNADNEQCPVCQHKGELTYTDSLKLWRCGMCGGSNDE